MQKWEYKRVMFVDVRTIDYAANKSYGKTHEEADAFIASLGNEGWESSGIASTSATNYTIIFKRPKK
jgi:hypothetical protein